MKLKTKLKFNSTNMNKSETFVNKFYPFAKRYELKSGINLIAILARQALETGWGVSAPGNMCFGIKANKSWKGERQLLSTYEEFADDKQGDRFPVLISITWNPKKSNYLYHVKDWFRAYDSIEDSYADHAQFYFANSRYSEALKFKSDWRKFITLANEAGYSTGKNVTKKLLSIGTSIEQIIEKLNLEATIKA